ncbi:MAG: MBL fold metallo-hydrolase [Bacteroidota bacterium]
MQRRRFLLNSSLCLAGLGLAPKQQLLASSLFSGAGNLAIIRQNVGFYTERGGTIAWLLSNEGSVIVDTQFPDQSQNLLSQLRERDELAQLDLLVNTHHHGDHTSGNPVFADLLKTHVAHINSKKNQERVAKERDQLDNVLLPATTYDKEWSTKVSNEAITLRYFGPGHTDGDSVIHFENANVAHLGDLIFNRRFPYIDPKSGGTFKNWAKVLGKISRVYDKETIFVFGHAAASYPVTGNINYVRAMRNYIFRLAAFT